MITLAPPTQPIPVSPQHPMERCTRRRRRRTVAAVALTVGGAALVGAGAFSSWDTTNSVSSGTLTAATTASTLLDANGGTFTTGVSNLLPGDYFYRYVDVRNDGSASNTYTGSVAVSGDLTAQLSVDAVTCSVAWTTVGGASTCAGTTGSSLGSGTPTSTTPVAIAHGTIGTGTLNAQHVRYKFTFSSAAPTALQGKTATISISVSSTLVGGNDRTTS